MSRKKEKKVKKRRRRRRRGRRRRRRKTGHYDTMPLETRWEDVDNILLKAFSL